MDILYHKRRLKANKMRRQVVAVRILLQRIRVFLALILIIVFCYFGIWVLRLPQWYIDSTKLANLDSSIIKIQGNNITPSEKILNMVKKTELPYTQIYRLDTEALEENIATLQPIKKVYIRRYWFPARLLIAIEERTPAFVLAPNLDSEPNSALTVDGVLIDKEYLPFKSNIKAKTILTYGVRNGVDEVWDKKRVSKLLEVTKVAEAYSNLEVKYIDLRNEKDAYIMLGDYLIRFGEFNDTAISRIRRIQAILPKAEESKNNIKYIDLSWEDSSYFRLKNSNDLKKEKVLENETTKDKKEVKVKTNSSEEHVIENQSVSEEEN